MAASNNGLLLWDTSLNKWQNVIPLPLISGGTNNDLSGSVNGDKLYCNGGEYINATILGQLLFNNSSTPYTITLTTAGTFEQLIPACTLTYSSEFSQSSNGVLEFTGTGTWRFKIYYAIMGFPHTNNRSIGIQLIKNGSSVAGSEMYQQEVSSALNMSIQGTFIQDLTTNDTIGLQAVNQTANNDLLTVIKFLIIIDPITRIS